MRVNKLNETKIVLAILESGTIELNKDKIDISGSLSMFKSKEYRKEDLDEITLGGRSDNQIKVHILACGSGDIPFKDEFKHNKVCILNFASSKHPGGGFITGAHAQEENLCYHSNLYKALQKHESFYEYNRNNLRKALYTDGIIYTENVLFFRQNFMNTIPRFADVITCAAPNRGAALRNGVKEIDIQRTMSRRLEQILKVAIENGNKNLVLGAFGCGVFRNDLEFVATEIKRLLTVKGYGKYFDNIILPALKKDGNEYSTFINVFRGFPNLFIED